MAVVIGGRAGASWLARAAGALLGIVPVFACGNDDPNPIAANASCVLAPSAAETCGEVGWRRPAAGEPMPSNEVLGLSVYSCTGQARPDDAPKYLQGVPQGMVCAARASVGGADAGASSDATNYCCSTATTPCAYNPLAICEEGNYGFQCRGALRPDAFNAALRCGNGVYQGDLLNYCCTGVNQVSACTQSNALGCPTRLMGYTCQDEVLPKGENLGSNQSRADFYRPLCSTPKQAANPKNKNYCCYMPALVPIGGSCVQHTAVPGCAPGRFGFACYGPETPEEDYVPMHCPDPGVKGMSAEGYPATLYCCDFQ